jgi:putative ABC transport system permease protein
MDRNYLATDPASATLWVDSADEGLARRAAELPAIAEAEARAEIVGRFLVEGGRWAELWLYVVPDFERMSLDLFTPELGAWPPATGEILLERTAVRVAKARIGDRVVVKIPGMDERSLSLTGTVHAPGLPPAWVEGRVYGYITPRTLALFGSGMGLNRLKILVAEDRFDKAAIARTANELKALLEAEGRTVSRIDVPEPGKHVHADLMSAFIAMLGAMGLLVLLMSGILVTNMIAALLGRQIRQIGVMKAIGGRPDQIAQIYFSMVAVLALAALAVGLPASLALGRSLADYEAVQMLNFEIFDDRVDLWAYGLVSSVGLVIPLLAAWFPIRKGTRVSVLSALGDCGIGQGKFGSSRIDRAIARALGALKGDSRPALLSLRNTFRRRGRLVLTLLTLVVAGASFITAVNVRASVNRAVAEKFEATPYDLEIAFSREYPQEEVELLVRQTEGVESAETWGGARATLLLPGGMLGGGQLSLIAPRLDTALSPKPKVVQGRWLRLGDANAMVISTGQLGKLDLEASVGDEIALDLYGQETTWRIVGVTHEFLATGAYVSFDSLSRAANRKTSTVVKVRASAPIDGVVEALEGRLDAAGLDVYATWKTSDARKVMEDHMLLVTGILLAMAALFVLVGALGLATTMSLNVLDRTRELGVMRAIGAGAWRIMRIIVVEGTFVGILGWMLAILLSVPFTAAMGRVIESFLESPMELGTSIYGWIVWLFVSMAIGALASALPAWKASRRPVAASLAYE